MVDFACELTSKSLDAAVISGFAFVATIHPGGNGVDLINIDSGQTVQTISCDGIIEIAWSSNTNHLAILVSTGICREVIIFSTVEEGVDCQAWRLLKELAIPVDFQYRGMSFAFPLVTLTATAASGIVEDGFFISPLLPTIVVLDVEVGSAHQISFPEIKEKNKSVTPGHTTITVPCSDAKLSSSGGFLAVFTSDLGFVSSNCADSNLKASSSVVQDCTYRSSGKLKLCVIDLFLSPALPVFPTPIPEPAVVAAPDALEANGSYAPAASQSTQLATITSSNEAARAGGALPFDYGEFLASKRQWSGGGDADFGSDNEEMDDEDMEGDGAKLGHVAKAKAMPPDDEDDDDFHAGNFELPGGLSSSMWGRGSDAVEVRSHQKNEALHVAAAPVEETKSKQVLSAKEELADNTCTPSYVDLDNNKTHSGPVDDSVDVIKVIPGGISFSRLSENFPLLSLGLGDPIETGMTFSWRPSEASTAESNELLLTVDSRDKGGHQPGGGDADEVVKIWSVCRREPPAPFTTVVTSISGVGSSYIVCGEINTSRNPKVSLLTESLISTLIYESPPIPTSLGSSTHQRPHYQPHPPSVPPPWPPTAIPTSHQLNPSRSTHTDPPALVMWLHHRLCPSAESAYLQDHFLSETSPSGHVGIATAPTTARNRPSSPALLPTPTAATTAAAAAAKNSTSLPTPRGFGVTKSTTAAASVNPAEKGSGLSGAWLAVLSPCFLLSSTGGRPLAVESALHKHNRPETDTSSGHVASTSGVHRSSGYFNYSLVCLHNSGPAHQYELVLKGKGPIFASGLAETGAVHSSVRSPYQSVRSSAVPFSAVASSIAVGRFGVVGADKPITVDFIAVLCDAMKLDVSSEGGSNTTEAYEHSKIFDDSGALPRRLVKIMSCVCEKKKGRFSLCPQREYDLLFDDSYRRLAEHTGGTADADAGANADPLTDEAIQRWNRRTNLTNSRGKPNNGSDAAPSPTPIASEKSVNTAASTAGSSTLFFDKKDDCGDSQRTPCSDAAVRGGGAGQEEGNGEDQTCACTTAVSHLQDLLPASPYSFAGAAQASIVPYDDLARFLMVALPPVSTHPLGKAPLVSAVSAALSASEATGSAGLMTSLLAPEGAVVSVSSSNASLSMWTAVHDPTFTEQPIMTPCVDPAGDRSSAIAGPTAQVHVITPVVSLSPMNERHGIVDMFDNFVVRGSIIVPAPIDNREQNSLPKTWSVLRAIVVRLPALSLDVSPTVSSTLPSLAKLKRRASTGMDAQHHERGSASKRLRAAQWLLVILRSSEAGSFEVATWVDGESHDSAGHLRQSSGTCMRGDRSHSPAFLNANAVAANVTDNEKPSLEHSGASRRSSKNISELSEEGEIFDERSSHASEDNEPVPMGNVRPYIVEVLPDRHFGLGMRLDVQNSRIVVDSFKRNPLTNAPLSAEASGLVEVGDELLAVNDNEMKEASLAEVIHTIRNVVQNSAGQPVRLKLLKASTATSEKSHDDFNMDEHHHHHVESSGHARKGSSSRGGSGRSRQRPVDAPPLQSVSCDSLAFTGSEDGDSNVPSSSVGSSVRGKSSAISDIMALGQKFRWLPSGVYPIDATVSCLSQGPLSTSNATGGELRLLSADLGVDINSGRILVSALRSSAAAANGSLGVCTSDLIMFELVMRAELSTTLSSGHSAPNPPFRLQFVGRSDFTIPSDVVNASWSTQCADSSSLLKSSDLPPPLVFPQPQQSLDIPPPNFVLQLWQHDGNIESFPSKSVDIDETTLHNQLSIAVTVVVQPADTAVDSLTPSGKLALLSSQTSSQSSQPTSTTLIRRCTVLGQVVTISPQRFALAHVTPTSLTSSDVTQLHVISAIPFAAALPMAARLPLPAAVDVAPLSPRSALSTSSAGLSGAAATAAAFMSNQQRSTPLRSKLRATTTNASSGVADISTTAAKAAAVLLPHKWYLLTAPMFSAGYPGDHRCVGTVLLTDSLGSLLLKAEVGGGVGSILAPVISDASAFLERAVAPLASTSTTTSTSTSAQTASSSSKDPPTARPQAISVDDGMVPAFALCTQVIDLAAESRHYLQADDRLVRASFGAQFFKWLDGSAFQVVLRNSTTMIFRKQLDLYTAMFTSPLLSSGASVSEIGSDMSCYISEMKSLVGYGFGRGGLWAKVATVFGGGFVGPSPFALALPSLQPSHSQSSASSALARSSALITAAGGEAGNVHKSTFMYRFHQLGALRHEREMGLAVLAAAPRSLRVSLHPVSIALQMFQSLMMPVARVPPTQLPQSLTSWSLSPSRMTLLAITAHRCRVLFQSIRRLAASAVDVNTGLVAEDLAGRDIPLLILLQRMSMALLPVARAYTHANSTTINIARFHAAYASLENLPNVVPPAVGNPNESGKSSSMFGVGVALSNDEATTQSRILEPLKGPEDYVLMYVLSEALVRLVYWGARGVCHMRRANSITASPIPNRRDRSRTLSDNATDEQAADAIAAKLVISLELDADAIDACFLIQCDAVLRGLLEGLAGLNPKGRENKDSSTEAPGHRRMQSLGLDSILKAAEELEGEQELMNKESELKGEYTGEIAVSRGRIGGVAVAQCLVSSSQLQLYEMLVSSVTIESTFQSTVESALQSVGAGVISADATATQPEKVLSEEIKMDMHTLGRLWSSRKLDESDVLELQLGGGEMNGDEADCDVLGVLYMSQVALWLHDVSPIGPLIADVALQRFKKKKESIQIFLEMVVAGQADKLMRLARADKNVSGKQLLALLSFEFNTDKGRNALRKNAFALMRLRRYKHAAAAFLCAEPPMIREACSVLCKQCNDPFTALLVARLVEHRHGPLARKGGYVLGPAARNVIAIYLLPGLLKGIANSAKANEFATSSKLRKELLKESFGVSGVDACALSLVCCMWLQDAQLMDRVLSHCCAHGIFAHAMPSARPLFIAKVPGAIEDEDTATSDNLAGTKKGLTAAPVVNVPKTSNVFHGTPASAAVSSFASATYNRQSTSDLSSAGGIGDVWSLGRGVGRARLVRTLSSSSINSNSSTGSTSASSTWVTTYPARRTLTNFLLTCGFNRYADDALVTLSRETSSGTSATSAGYVSISGGGVSVAAGDVIADRARNCFRAAALVRWLYCPSRGICADQLGRIGGAVDAFITEYGLSVEKSEACMLLTTLRNHPSAPPVLDAFRRACAAARESWRAAKAAAAAAKEADRLAKEKLAMSVGESGSSGTVDIDDDVQAALARLSKMTVTATSVGTDVLATAAESSHPEDIQAPTSTSKKMGFNLAREPPKKKSAAPQPSALDMFDAPPPRMSRPSASQTSGKPTEIDAFDATQSRTLKSTLQSGNGNNTAQTPNALDFFDVPQRPARPAAQKPNALDMFDAPQRPARPAAQTPNALDMFDAPQRPARPAAQTPNALDMFDAPQRPARPAAQTPNALDMFDAPQHSARPAAQTPNALDMFDAPQRPARPAAQTPNALDMFDAPQRPARPAAQTPNALDMFDAPQRPARPAAQTPNALDMFDAPQRPARPAAQTPNALDMFDAPQRPARPAAQTPNALDMFDAPQRPARPAAQTPNALDMFDAPQRPARPAAQTPNALDTKEKLDGIVNAQGQVFDEVVTNSAGPLAAYLPVASVLDMASPSDINNEVALSPSSKIASSPSVSTSAPNDLVDTVSSHVHGTPLIPSSAETQAVSISSAPLNVDSVPSNHPQDHLGSTAGDNISSMSTSEAPPVSADTSCTNELSETSSYETSTDMQTQSIGAPRDHPVKGESASSLLVSINSSPKSTRHETLIATPPSTVKDILYTNTPSAVVDTHRASTTTTTAAAAPTSSTVVGSNAKIPPSSPSDTRTVEQRVRAFYRQHNPSKLSSVDSILRAYAGREKELLEKLKRQYNVSTI